MRWDTSNPDDLHALRSWPCHLDVRPGAFHAFDRFVPKARVSMDFYASHRRMLTDALGIQR